MQGRGGAGFPLRAQVAAWWPRPPVRAGVCHLQFRRIRAGNLQRPGHLPAAIPIFCSKAWRCAGTPSAPAKDSSTSVASTNGSLQRLERAIAQAEEQDWLGADIQNSRFSFHLHVHRGAGAYICGEETALLESLECRRGEPRVRPPYPTTEGYLGQPTVVNNVESFCTIPPVLNYGAEWYRSMGTANSPGAKVFTVWRRRESGPAPSKHRSASPCARYNRSIRRRDAEGFAIQNGAHRRCGGDHRARIHARCAARRLRRCVEDDESRFRRDVHYGFVDVRFNVALPVVGVI